MKTFLQKFISIYLLLITGFAQVCFAQSSSKSILVNHGATSCGTTTPQQHFIIGTMTNTPSIIASCDIGLPYYNVLTAYNPADHKIYFAYMPGSSTSVYEADYNFGGNIVCPSVPTPTYVYNYQLNQLCFDNNGNNYAFFSFDAVNGTAHLAQVDVTTGNVTPGTEKIIYFPANNIPNSVLYGDVVILPNGRMFASFGNSPSKLFEITNITGPGDATAVFLCNIPRPCFSIGFIDGNLTIAGSDGGGCYYYIWDINSFALSSEKPFPLGKNTADMTNITLALGATKELMGSLNVNSNTAYLYYRIVVKNKGNIFANNIQVTDNLASVFGSGNISNISVSFVSNPANLQLNPNYDGQNDVNLLAPNQMLNNYPAQIDSVVIDLIFSATHLNSNVVYNNSAIASGVIGAGSNFLSVSDSSNNGDASRMDLDGNGVSDDPGENVPTPYVFAFVLPLSQLNLSGTRNDEITKLTWKGLTDQSILNYEIERSFDGKAFQSIGKIQSGNQINYSYNDSTARLQQSIFYRLKLNKSTKFFVYSNTLTIKTNLSLDLSAYPNPFTNQINVQAYFDKKTKANLIISDISGRVLINNPVDLQKGNNYFSINEANKLATGTYILEISAGAETKVLKLVKK